MSEMVVAKSSEEFEADVIVPQKNFIYIEPV